MENNYYQNLWKAEQEAAHMLGWDFSYIAGRYNSHEDELSWNYCDVVKRYLSPDKKLLDLDTGGGEVLLSLRHPYHMTSATESYPPNVKLCGEKLLPLGIDFRFADDDSNLPFEDKSFDVVINRHGAYDDSEIWRILKSGGVFITQQVGEDNDKELIELLCPGVDTQFKGWNLQNAVFHFEEQGFTILEQDEDFKPIEFYDVGALIWFARIIEWEFVGFSVEHNFEQICKAHEMIKKYGSVEGRIHRFLIAAQKN